MLQDQTTIKEQGQMYLLAGDLSDQNMQINVSISRLGERVLDHDLRMAIGDFTTLCANLNQGSGGFPGGKVPDDQREGAIEQLRRQTVRMTDAYVVLTGLLGMHLRRELDRRHLVAPPSGEVAARVNTFVTWIFAGVGVALGAAVPTLFSNVLTWIRRLGASIFERLQPAERYNDLQIASWAVEVIGKRENPDDPVVLQVEGSRGSSLVQSIR